MVTSICSPQSLRPLPARPVPVGGRLPSAGHPSCSGAGLAPQRSRIVAQAVPEIQQGVADAGAATAETVAKAGSSGPFDFLAHLFEGALTNIDHVFEKAGIPYSYGFAIIALTFIVKLATYPLTKKQVESTVAMQALQPSVKQLQAQYANDPERLQLETQRLYKEAQVNPLAGCLPTLATIPVFIGLYRALTLAAQDGLLNQGFFIVPSLGGPTTSAQQAANQGMQWLFPFVDGQPPLGWEDTAKYLLLPVLLILSQYASLSISQPAQSDDPSVQTTQRVLKLLPLMIGWFSLNVPAGMCVYWLTNNVLTTAQQAYLKKVTKVDTPKVKASGTFVKAEQDGDSASAGSSSDTRRSKKGEKFRARQAALAAESSSSNGGDDSRGKKKKKGDKFAKRKAQQGQSQQPASAAAPMEGQPTAEKAAETVATAAVDKVKETTEATRDA